MYQDNYKNKHKKKYYWRLTDKDIEEYEAYRKRNEPSLLRLEPATGLPSRRQRECIALIKNTIPEHLIVGYSDAVWKDWCEASLFIKRNLYILNERSKS